MNLSWRYQSFDTKILGFRTAKIIQQKNAFSIPGLLRDLKKNKISYATIRVEAKNNLDIQALEKAGFLVVDGIIALDKTIKESDMQEQSMNIVKPKKNDWKEIEALAEGTFYLNRFYNDPIIEKQKAAKIFSEWMKNSLLGKAADSVFIYKDKNIEGFITMQKDGHIPLVGVSSHMRGKGIGKELVLYAVSKFAKNNVKKSTIETQIANIPAIRLYESCGFRAINSFLTLRWTSVK